MPRKALLCVLTFAAWPALAPAQDSAAAPVVQSVSGSDDPWAAINPEIEPRPLPRRGAPVATGTAPAPITAAPRASWLRTTLSLAGILGLIGLLAWGYRTIQGHGRLPFAARGRHPGLIEVLSRTTLAPRHALCLVRVGPRLVLLGLTPDAVRALDVIADADLTAQLAAQATRARPDSATAEFRGALERESRAYQPNRTELDELVTPDEERVVAVRTRLASTIDRLRGAAHSA